MDSCPHHRRLEDKVDRILLAASNWFAALVEPEVKQMQIASDNMDRMDADAIPISTADRASVIAWRIK